MKIENYNGEDRFVSNPNTKEDQKRTKKNKKNRSTTTIYRRKERKRAENVPENSAPFIIAKGDIFLFLASFDSVAMDSRSWSLLRTLSGEVR